VVNVAPELKKNIRVVCDLLMATGQYPRSQYSRIHQKQH